MKNRGKTKVSDERGVWMNLSRMWQSFRLLTMNKWSAKKKYLIKHHVYGYLGNNSYIQSPFIPLYARLIRIHDNVMIGKNVTFITHDVIHKVVNRMDYGVKWDERVGCVEVMDNVFIGANATIMSNVRIGPNAIVAAGSVVTKDVPANSVVGGVPAKVLGTFDDYVRNSNEKMKAGKLPTVKRNQYPTEEEIDRAWQLFEKERS